MDVMASTEPEDADWESQMPAWERRMWEVGDWISRGSFVFALGWAVYAFFWGASWTPAIDSACAWAVVEGSMQCAFLALRVQIWVARWQGRRYRALVEERERQIVQLRILQSQQEQELAAKRAYISALRAETTEYKRLCVQLQAAHEAKMARQRLEIACKQIEAERLESEAQRMEARAEHLELRLEQVALWRSVEALEDDAQNRIRSAYQVGFEHGRSGATFKFGRHLWVVDSSA